MKLKPQFEPPASLGIQMCALQDTNARGQPLNASL